MKKYLNNISKTQITTLFLTAAYLVWEFFVWRWTLSSEVQGPIIRVDLIIIYPILFLLFMISIYQLIKNKYFSKKMMIWMQEKNLPKLKCNYGKRHFYVNIIIL